LDLEFVAVDVAIPSLGLASQCGDIPGPSLSKALATEDANLNFSLVEPTSMLWRVVNGKTIPQPCSRRFAQPIHQRLAGMGAQVVHDQMDGVGGGIVRSDLQDEVGKLGGRARGRHFGEMNASLGLDAAKDVGRTAALVLIVTSCHLSRLHGNRSPRILMQHHRLFVDANHRLTF